MPNLASNGQHMEVMVSSINIGILLPTRETAMVGTYDFTSLLKFARQAEELGFESVWAGDSFVVRPRHEPLTLLAAVAAATERVSIGTAALIAVRREPSTLAHTIVTLDHVSEGRLQLAIGTGAPLPIKTESDAVTMGYDERAGRVDEAVAAWKTVWHGRDGDLTGRYWDLSGLRQQPPPAKTGGPSLWLASNNSPKAFARAAHYYDGWMPLLPDPGEYERGWKAIREAAIAKGRSPDELTPSLFATVNLGPDPDRARAELEAYSRQYYGLPLEKMSTIQPYFGGSPEGCVEWLSAYVRAGARHFVLRMGSFDAPEKHLQATAEVVLPALRELAV
jgi:alkanesulfonate monooxygenase SsuD/methylene tetrahydromethanopterin reductase-like flavin-dependent oxidoreductase (luciferase family)